MTKQNDEIIEQINQDSRKVYYIDVGDLSADKAAKIIEEVKKQFERKDD